MAPPCQVLDVTVPDLQVGHAQPVGLHAGRHQQSLGDVHDWSYLADATVMHLSGITAALGDPSYDIVMQAAEQARRVGQLLSVDVNHRAHLWWADMARAQLSPVLEQADIIFCSRRDADALLRLTGDPAEVAERLADTFGAKTVVVPSGAGLSRPSRTANDWRLARRRRMSSTELVPATHLTR